MPSISQLDAGFFFVKFLLSSLQSLDNIILDKWKGRDKLLYQPLVDNHTVIAIKQFVPAFSFVKYYYNELT